MVLQRFLVAPGRGVGTGILCLFAAQAGAAKVIGIERSDVAQKVWIPVQDGAPQL
jgi:predicted RNA methylase